MAERVTVIPGERLDLTTITRDDLPTLTRWFADLEINAYLGRPGHFVNEEQEREWFEHQAKDQSLRTFGIMVKESRSFIGTISLMHINLLHQSAELGVCIGERSAWSKGYGTEAVRLVVEYGFGFLSLYNIYLWHSAFNERGHQAYIQAGFKEAGRLRGRVCLNGERYDSILMDITREEITENQVMKRLSPVR